MAEYGMNFFEHTKKARLLIEMITPEIKAPSDKIPTRTMPKAS